MRDTECTISSRILLSSLQYSVYLTEIIGVSVNRLILKYEKEPPCQRFPISDIADQSDIVLPDLPAFLAFLFFRDPFVS